MPKVASTWGTPRGARGIPGRQLVSKLFPLVQISWINTSGSKTGEVFFWWALFTLNWELWCSSSLDTKNKRATLRKRRTSQKYYRRESQPEHLQWILHHRQQRRFWNRRGLSQQGRHYYGRDCNSTLKQVWLSTPNNYSIAMDVVWVAEERTRIRT